MNSVTFENKVAIVTGAAGGIGYGIAEELARRGARLLVNDYGGDTYGNPGNSDRIEAAAEKLRALGAKAVTNSCAVGTPQAAREIVANALDAFGRVDILVNNAGVSLPGLITDFNDSDVDNHFYVNLLGPYALVRAVWPTMKEQGFGRILNTSSNAAMGIGANAPYATTKAGLLGLTLDAAMEGQQHGILVNAIMPTAFTRMIEQIPDPQFVDWFRRYMPPDKVARSVVYLLGENSTITGRIFATGGGRIARVAFAEGKGWLDSDITAESIAAHWQEIDDMQDATILNGQADEMALFSQAFPFDSGVGGPSLDRNAVVGAAAGKPAGFDKT